MGVMKKRAIKNKSKGSESMNKKDKKEPNGAAVNEKDMLKLSGADSAGDNSIEKVRTILFGNQMHEYDRRFSQLEGFVQQKIDSLRDDTKKTIGALENYAKKEVQSLAEKQKKEKDERNEAMKELKQEIKELRKSFEKKSSELSDQASTTERELRQEILELSKNLREEIKQSSEKLSEELSKAVQELRTDKINRTDLAGILTEIAMRISNELNIPDLKD